MIYKQQKQTISSDSIELIVIWSVLPDKVCGGSDHFLHIPSPYKAGQFSQINYVVEVIR